MPDIILPLYDTLTPSQRRLMWFRANHTLCYRCGDQAEYSWDSRGPHDRLFCEDCCDHIEDVTGVVMRALHGSLYE